MIKETKGRILKSLILFGIYVVLLIPLLQETTHFKTYIDKLNGAYVEEPDIAFCWDDWFKGSYQNEKEKFINANFGLHNYYIRLNAQINFNVFKKTNVANMVIGKQNYLYELDYINAYYGKDFIGDDKIKSLVSKMKRIQDTLQKQNKMLLVVFAPGKASFYPEYINDQNNAKPQKNNYEGFTEYCKKYNLNHIDFNDYFKKQKKRSKYPLYPQYGIHWSNYGSMLAFDSIVKFIENKVKINLPDLQIKGIEVSDSLRNTDNDALLSLNLLVNPKTFKMAYPKWIVKLILRVIKKLNY